MSDKVRLQGTGRVVKEPTTTSNGGLAIDIVANLFDKTADDKQKPMWIRCFFAQKSRLFDQLSKFTQPLKGSRVWFDGDFSFNQFEKKDGTAGLGFNIFPSFFEVHSNTPKTNDVAVTETTAETSKGNDLPF